MAITREKTTTIFLGNIVSSNIDSFVAERKRIRAREEAAFYKNVVDNGLSTTDQIEYFKNKIKAEKDRAVSDTDYIAELKGSLADLNKIKRAEDFYNDYRTSFEQLKTSRKNIDYHINFLQTELGEAVDSDLKTKIQDALSEAKTTKFTIKNDMISNQVQLALTDNRQPALTGAIKTVNKARNDALVSGDDLLVSQFDLKLQSLNMALQSTKINDAVHDLEVEMLDTAYSPVEFFNKISSRVAEASSDNVPVYLNGVKYNNEKEFWDLQMGDFLQNKFFELIGTDVQNKIDAANIKLTHVLEKEIKKQVDIINGLKNNPFFEPYLDKLEKLGLDASSYGVEKLGVKINRDYSAGLMGATSSDNLNNAINKLNNLNKQYGVDVFSNIEKIVQDASAKKSQVSNNLLDRALFEMENNGKTIEEALAIAQQNVSALDIPSADMAASNPVDIAKDTISSLDTTKPASKYDLKTPATTPVQPVQQVSQSAPSVYKDGDLLQRKGSKTVYKLENNKLRPFVGAWDDNSFSKYTGKTFKDVQVVDNIKGYGTGEIIRRTN